MSSSKSWDHPWSTDEIIANSGSWSLAGDVALLNNLKKFADNLIKNTGEIDDNLHKLTSRLDEASLQLEVAQNRFQSLRNTQFIESRVYEDDETLHVDKQEIPAVQSEKTEHNKDKDHTSEIKEAVFKGLDILEKYYDKVEVSISDSSSDEGSSTDLPSHILRPKDPYLNRPLPFVIGSEEWHKNWHVGLEDSSSESETEKVSENYSESDSEDDLQVTFDRSQLKGSETSSELDLSKNGSLSNNKALYNKPDVIFGESSDSDSGRIPSTDIISSENFAKQLSDKLGDVIGRKQVEGPEINKRPIAAAPQKVSRYADAFFDEPPPLDDDDVNSEKGGLFSSNTGLFDDDDDEDLWNQNQSETRSRPALPTQSQSSSKPNEGLFDDNSSVTSGDDIFSANKKLPAQSFVKSNRPPIIDDEPPALKQEQKKKPVGGVSMFGASDLFDKKLLRRQIDSDDESETDRVANKNLKPSNVTSIEKKDDVKRPVAKNKLNLFDDDDGDDDDDDIIKRSVGGIPKPIDKEQKKIDLFNDEDDDDDSEDMFSASVNVHPVKSSEIIKIDKEERKDSSVKKVSLFDDDDRKVAAKSESTKSAKKTISLFDDDDDLFKGDLFSSTTTKKFTSSLFDDDDGDDSPDIFTESNKNVTNTDIPKNNTAQSAGLFFDSPPPDDLFTDKTDPEITDIPAEKEKPLEKYIPPLVNSPPPSDLFADKENQDVTDFEDDLFSTTKNDDLFGDIVSSTKRKSVSLFDSSPPSDDDDIVNVNSSEKAATSLFGSSPPPDDVFTFLSPKKKSNNVSSLFEEPSPVYGDTSQKESSDIFASSAIDDDDLFAATSSRKVTEITKKMEKEEVTPKAAAVTSPGKLKHNLNINVGALIPGSRPPPLLERNREVPVVDSEIVEESISTPTSVANKSVGHGDGVEVLQSVTKDRVRVPLNRRPSTRRGRQAAIRNSQNSDFFIISPTVPTSSSANHGGDDEITKNMVTDEKVISSINQKSGDGNLEKRDIFEDISVSSEKELFGDDFEPNMADDLFAEPELKPSLTKSDKVTKEILKDKIFASESQTSNKTVKKGISEDIDSTIFSKDDIFTSKSHKVGSDFEPNINDDLFAGPDLDRSSTKNADVSKVFPKDEFVTSETHKSGNEVNKGLFDDDFDDQEVDDLFAKSESSSSVNVKEEVPKSLDKDVGKVSKTSDKVSKGLFDGDDDDDDLFAPKSKKSSSLPTAKMQKSLFDDDNEAPDDDDDIFKPSKVVTSQVKKPETKIAVERKIPKVRKLENTKSEDDPLSAFTSK